MILRLTVALLVAAPVATSAQQQGDSGFSVRYEVSRDRFHYRFENPSSFSTTELVPHEFTQTYWGDTQWAAVRARYRLGRLRLETEVAATPQRSTRGDDFDTFFQPDGDVVGSGTTGNVSMRSWRVRQTSEIARVAGFAWRIGFAYRRDRSLFHPGEKIVTHTRPPSRDVSVTYDRETTFSETYESQLGVSRRWQVPHGWRVEIDVEMAPTTLARLTTILPDKYPGQEIVFSALVFTLSPTLTVSRGERWPVSLSLGFTRTFSYVSSRQFERNALAVGVGVGFAGR